MKLLHPLVLLTMISAPISTVLCDPFAFYPFRELVKGPFKDPANLMRVERFLRAVVLHDEIIMDAEPFPFDGEPEREWTESEIEAGVRPVIVAIGPSVAEYGIFNGYNDTVADTKITLSADMLSLAERLSNASGGNAHYKAHVSYIQRLIAVVNQGGSVVSDGSIARAFIAESSKWPKALFEQLDTDWVEYAQAADQGSIGVAVPPVLAIILNRSSTRDDIPKVLANLRDEWANARQKYGLLH